MQLKPQKIAPTTKKIMKKNVLKIPISHATIADTDAGQKKVFNV